MKRKQSILILLFTSIILASCSSDDSENSETPPETTIRLVKSERVNDNFKTEYSYNSNDELIIFNGTYPNVTFESDLTYDSNNRLIQDSYQELSPSSFSNIQNFNYDSSGLLIGYSDSFQNISINYNGNIITLNGNFNGVSNSEVVLEMNGISKVTKLIEDNKYLNFEYDSNDNMTSVKYYNNSDELLSEYNIQYDDKINPFYGQFQSIYIERFIEWFQDFEGVLISGFEGFSFPYLKNNIVSISNGISPIITYDYTYDNQDYPINIVETSNGNIFDYEIEYYE